ncbi:carbonic anhydrase [Dermacoccus sp. SAI-028]|uniref:carbonic anhydrase n=1 Tax=Dermacoccus TaxID=57495 RepID=UPI001046A8B6|nr:MULTISPECIES: carbonic anhydrase [Dermacoccus]TCJ91011.1 carbonic anhydrase [Dermacoccus sp. SAI-028]
MSSTLTPQQAWDTLVEGNRRFVSGTTQRPHSDGERRRELVAGQAPQAVIFGCGDSRVPAEMIFDQGLGDLFVVRTAGHVLDPSVLGSIEFGTEVLRAPLVVVLGHKSCGAINATLAAEETGDMPPGYLHTIIERVMPSILHGRKHGLTTGEQFEAEHARATSELLPQRSQLIRDRIDAGRLAVVAVHYDIGEGEAHVVGTLGDITA